MKVQYFRICGVQLKLRVKTIALNAYIRREDWSQINNPNLFLKKLIPQNKRKERNKNYKSRSQ
jgi:hypothetical protein